MKIKGKITLLKNGGAQGNLDTDTFSPRDVHEFTNSENMKPMKTQALTGKTLRKTDIQEE